MRPRMLAFAAAAATLAAGLPALADLGSLGLPASSSQPRTALDVARDASPVVLTGAQIPGWAAPAAVGVAKPQPSGASSDNPLGDEVRTAHNGTLSVPATPPTVTPVRPNQVAAFAWNGQFWKPIRVQVDQRFPYFLANGRSGFGFYSGTDEELTYDWSSDRHSVGEESWKAMFGQCDSRFASSKDEIAKAIDAGWLSLGPQEKPADYLASMHDPQPLLDTDDEVSFMASDAGPAAPQGTLPPEGSTSGQVVRVVDPLRPAVQKFVYLFAKPGGSKFGAADGYVQLDRDAGSTRWVDRYAYDDASPDKIGSSNTGYGPNLPGTVCDTSPENLQRFHITDATTPRASTDREPRDSFTVSTPTYRLHATGRWLIQDLRVRRPDAARGANAPADPYGPNVIARWKGRAFQQNPDSSVSLVGFEDEQVNWEMNSALLGWRQGAVRAIREVWGADSGTNVTKTETYYRDADAYAYHVRVHPIPPDGLYTDWSYRPGVATTYYNVLQTKGVPIDGQEDTSGNEVDEVAGQKAYVNSCDPKFTACSAIDNPEEIAGKGFGLVYEFELTGPTGAAGNAAVVPYYRDDACFDDGTGDAPVPRPWPGESSTDSRVQNGYLAYWQQYWDAHPEAQGFPRPTAYSDLKCQPALAVHGDPTANPTTPPWQIMPFSGAIGQHGIHFFATQDSDNAFGPKNVDEIDGQQWRYSISMAEPINLTTQYGANVSAKLVPVVTPWG